MKIGALLLLVSVFIGPEVKGQSYCYSLDEDPYDLHAEFTGYFPLENTNSDPLEFDGKFV